MLVSSLICGALGGVSAWRAVTPLYRSDGLLRIAYELPAVEVTTDQNQPMGGMYDTFMQSQKMLIQSRRVIDLAIEDPIWKAKGYQIPPDPERYYASNLTVDVKPRSEFIDISVTDSDPVLAATAVNAILNAYVDVYKAADAQREHDRISVLQDRISFLEGRIKAADAALTTAVGQYGSTDLDVWVKSAEMRVMKLDAAISDLSLAMATAPSTGALPATSQPVQDATAGIARAVSAAPLSIEQIAAMDPAIVNLLNEEHKARNEVERLKAAGLGDRHKDVAAAELVLIQIESEVDRETDTFRKFHGITAQNLTDPSEPGPRITTAGKSREALRGDLKVLKELYDQAKTQLLDVGRRRYELAESQRELNTVRTELTEKRRRLTTLQEEGEIGGRLSIVSAAEVPVSPEPDRRRKLVPAGAMAAACLPAGLVLLLSVLQKRYSYSDETRAAVDPQVPMLGILPELPTSTDTEKMLSAAHSVHQIRVALLAHSLPGDCHSYLVSSAEAGEGKTSLTMSLALSLSAARVRTLVIDGDLIARRFSEGMNLSDANGLNEALAAGSMRHLLRRTAFGLYVLPSGKATAADACTISAISVRALLAEAKHHFDVVLIDSGPLLGSVEAAVFAQEVDGVIFTISRGKHRGAVMRAMNQLHALGVRVEGLVFNRAKWNDFDSASYISSSSRSSGPVGTDALVPSQPPRVTRFGPLVEAVTLTMPVSQN